MVDNKTSKSFTYQGTVLSNIVKTVTATKTAVEEAGSLSRDLLNSVRKLVDLCTFVRSTVTKMLMINMATYKKISELQISLPSRIERSLINEPFILEDAIGRMSPVHLQYISSWAAFEAVLETRFRGIQGYKKVTAGHWVLQDHVTGREIPRDSCWEGTFLPGQRVNMSLLFERESTIDDFGTSKGQQADSDSNAACPRCQTQVLKRSGPDNQCGNCGLYFRRITEIHETTPEPTPQQPSRWESKPTFGKPSLPPKFGPTPPAKRRRENTVDDLDISRFKRIRIHSKLNTIRKHVFMTLKHNNATSGVMTRSESQANIWEPKEASTQDHGAPVGVGVTVLGIDHEQQQGLHFEPMQLSDITPGMHLKFLPRHQTPLTPISDDLTDYLDLVAEVDFFSEMSD